MVIGTLGGQNKTGENQGFSLWVRGNSVFLLNQYIFHYLRTFGSTTHTHTHTHTQKETPYYITFLTKEILLYANCIRCETVNDYFSCHSKFISVQGINYL